MKCKKVTYRNHDQAVSAIHLISSRGVKKQYTPVKAYECEQCNMWHITHRPIEEYLEHHGESFDLQFKDKWRHLQT